MGAEKIVTVRLPAAMLAALKHRTERDHYVDLSEQVRSIIRNGCLKHTRTTIPERLKDEILKETSDARAEALLEGLRKILREYGGEAR